MRKKYLPTNKKKMQKLTSLFLCSSLILSLSASTVFAEADFADDFSDDFAVMEESTGTFVELTDFLDTEEMELPETEENFEFSDEFLFTEDSSSDEVVVEEEELDFVEDFYVEDTAAAEAALQGSTGKSDRAVCTMDATTLGIGTPDELFNLYADRAFGLKPNVSQGTPANSSRNSLTNTGKKIYDLVKKEVEKIALGTRSSTSIEVTMSQLGFPSRLYGTDLGIGRLTSDPDYNYDLSGKVETALEKYFDYDPIATGWALVRDCPAEFYWFDLTFYYTPFWWYESHYDSSRGEYYVTLTPSYDFHVNNAFRANDNLLEVNTSKAQRLKTAVANAQKIVNNAASYSDGKKLDYYRDKITNLVEYDYVAANSIPDTGGYGKDGNPWQIISVFDNDPTTNIVCEGYAKAFKYLCDQTTFEHKNIECVIATGQLHCNGVLLGEHAWNVIHINTGKNYLVDLTSYDEGNGYTAPAFYMASPVSGSYAGGYKILSDQTEYTYVYNNDTKRIFTVDDLTLTQVPYDPSQIGIPWLTKPTLKSVENKPNGVHFTWNAVPEAEKYVVYRKVSGGSWTKVAVTSQTYYRDSKVEAGKNYTYSVRCIDATSSIYTSNYNTTGLSITYYPAPKLTSVTNAYTGAEVKWEAVNGISYYRVFRKDGSSSTWKQLNVTSSCNYTDTTAASGKVYTYTVRGCDSAGTKFYTGFDSTGVKTTFYAAPKLSSITNSVDGVTVRWQASAGAERYRVFRKTGSGSWQTLGYTKGTGYIDRSAVSETTYSYTVRCVNANDTTCTSGFSTTGKTITYIAPVTLSAVSNQEKGIRLTWKASPGAVKYRVFRREPGGTWKAVFDTTNTGYTNTAVASGKTYEYTVRCINADGSAYTSADSLKYLSITRN